MRKLIRHSAAVQARREKIYRDCLHRCMTYLDRAYQRERELGAMIPRMRAIEEQMIDVQTALNANRGHGR